MLVVVSAGCGARTGLNTPQEGSPPGLTVSAAIQCGFCMTEAFCYAGLTPSPPVDAIVSCSASTPGCNATSCAATSGTWIGVPVETYGASGAIRPLFCVRNNGSSSATLPAGQREMIPPPPNSITTNWVDPCLLSDEEYPRWMIGTAQGPLGTLRTSLCGLTAADIDATGHYRCDRIASFAAPSENYSVLAPAQCPKRAMMASTLRVCVANTSAGETLGRRLLATYAAAHSPVGSYTQPEVTIPLYMCFARRNPLAPSEPGTCTRARRSMRRAHGPATALRGRSSAHAPDGRVDAGPHRGVEWFAGTRTLPRRVHARRSTRDHPDAG